MKSHIFAKITRGEFRSGDRLMEEEIAAEMGISRTPVRLAFTQLALDGFVEQSPRRGTYFRTLTPDEVDEFYNIRAMLEGYGASRAAERLSPQQLQQLAGYCKQMHEQVRRMRDQKLPHMDAEGARIISTADIAFHLLIARASGSVWVSRIVQNFRLMLALTPNKDIKSMTLHEQAGTWRSHVRIYRALLKRDGERAEQLLRHHILRARISAISLARAESSSGASHNAGEDSVISLFV